MPPPHQPRLQLKNGVPSLANLSLPPAKYLRLLPESSAPRRYLHLCMDREGGKRGWGGGDGSGEAHGVSNRCAWNMNGKKAIYLRYFWKNSSLTAQKTRLVLLAWEIIVNGSKILSGHQQFLSVENKDILLIYFLAGKTLSERKLARAFKNTNKLINR